MTYGFELTVALPASPQTVYDTWVSSKGHGSMTGAGARIDPAVGGAHEAWDGYISGVIVALDPGRRIVQTWRTPEFLDDDDDSQIEVLLAPSADGTTLTLRHTRVPDRLRGFEEGGWEENYFEPMRRYFATAH